jgi:hypothetical protein
MQNFAIKRSAQRIPVEMPVHLEKGDGVTRDVSQSGVFFFTDQTFSTGAPLRFALELDYVSPGEKVLLHCRGEVVRVEEAGEKTGVAASISEFWCAA